MYAAIKEVSKTMKKDNFTINGTEEEVRKTVSKAQESRQVTGDYQPCEYCRAPLTTEIETYSGMCGCCSANKAGP